MNREQRERMVDRLLDETLGPQLVQPRVGFEERILANLRAQPVRRPWWTWKMFWVPAALTAVVLLAVLLRVSVWRGSPAGVPDTQATRQQPAPAVGPPSAQHSLPATHNRSNHSVTRPPVTVTADHGLPRQQVFPSPVPLTAEEQMLLALSRRNPQEAVLVAREREMEWERVLKNFDDEAKAPAAAPATR